MNDDIEERMAKLRQAGERLIKEVGWYVQSVAPVAGEEGCAFNYSVGLYDKGLPEILVLGLPLQVGHELINDVARYLIAQKAMGSKLAGEVRLPRWPTSFVLLAADPAQVGEYAYCAVSRSQGAAQFLQIVWPDKEGRFPWAHGATDSFRAAQPVLATVN
ncbi:DUF4262 domain-containing protein [Paucibacter soli]|uniref:DUF4262 domain-containing protein n=1 Tax=Paucibacter soli TaxID=3133433 RepID=UPI00309DAB95